MTYYPNINADKDIAVVNGGFDADSDWIKGFWWTIGGGVADIDVGGGFRTWLSQANVNLIPTNLYDITFTILGEYWDAGNGIRVGLGGNYSSAPYKENGQHTCRIECGTTTQWIQFANELLTVGVGCSIDNVSISAVGSFASEELEIDYRKPCAAVIYDVLDGDRIFHALNYKDKTNCIIKYTP